MLFPCKEGIPVLFHCSCSLQNRSFFFRVFEASEGKREAGVEHETRPTGDNFLRAFPRRVPRAPLPLHASLPLPENAKRIACFLYHKHGGRPQQALWLL